jgi:signal transduction histidine kinase
VKDARSALGVAIVGALLLFVAITGEVGLGLGISIGDWATGLFVATAAFGLFAYREHRDPTLLLVGAGAAGLAIHRALILVLLSATSPTGSRTASLFSRERVTGCLVLAGALLAVIPLRDRRGRPPLEPARVAIAILAGFAVLDLIAWATPSGGASMIDALSGRLDAFAWIGLDALALAGVTIAVRSLGWGGRFGWVAAAGAALAAFAIALLLLTSFRASDAVRFLGAWTTMAEGLAGASLVVFVLAGLRLEASHQRRATDRAAEVMAGRAEIAATIAHDVRGPVGTIKGLATTTRTSYEKLDDAQRREFVGMIEDESARLMRLVDQVALALKVDAGSLELTRRRQEVGPIVERAAEETETGAHPLTVDAPAGIEASVDTRWFGEVVMQAVDNAARFSPADAPITVTARRGPDGGAVVLVADAGPGIPAAMRDAVFEKFCRWRPDGYEDRQGSGLGLFVGRGIARGHGGDVTLDDTPTGGTMLRIRVPAEDGR